MKNGAVIRMDVVDTVLVAQRTPTVIRRLGYVTVRVTGAGAIVASLDNRVDWTRSAKIPAHVTGRNVEAMVVAVPVANAIPCAPSVLRRASA